MEYSKININNNVYKIELNNFFDLSIPLDFKGKQVNFFDTPRSSVKALQTRGKKLLVSEGFGCDVQEVTINIHCTTTHTECVGHISKEEIFINEVLEYQNEVNHDGKIIIEGDKVTISVYTHRTNLVTEIDMEYAKSVDEIHDDVMHFSERDSFE